MKWWLCCGLVAGCDVVQELLPVPPCEDRVEVDAVSGAAELVLDASRCDRDDLVANRVAYDRLDDADWEPLVAADANPCNSGSTQVLVEDLPGDELAVAPVWPEPLPPDVWMRVSYWDHRASGSGWTTYFRLGHPDNVVPDADCVTD